VDAKGQPVLLLGPTSDVYLAEAKAALSEVAEVFTGAAGAGAAGAGAGAALAGGAAQTPAAAPAGTGPSPFAVSTPAAAGAAVGGADVGGGSGEGVFAGIDGVGEQLQAEGGLAPMISELQRTMAANPR
jgi:hypothetical protein